MKLGISGALTRTFIGSPLTPLLLLASLLVGLIALQALPREEEPQISVPMVDIIVSTNGYKAQDAIELVTRPLEDIIKGINGVEHVYSLTQDDNVMVTARFFVGTPQDNAVLRVHDKIRGNITGLPKGIREPLIIGRGIDDVAIVVLTLAAKPERAAAWTDNGLYQVAEELQHDLTKVDNVGGSYIVGGAPNQIRVEPDPGRLSLYGITLNQLVDKLTNANRSFLVGAFRDLDHSLPVVAGQTLQGVPDIGLLLLTSRDGRPVYVKDVADVRVGAAEPEHFGWTMTRNATGALEKRPAVSIAIAKRKGANAVVMADEILRRLETVKGRIVPDDLEISVTRNYGETATEKANELLFHLALATLSIVGLIVLMVGWREGVVVFVIIPTTILLTMFASWMMGYTINRVSLFALIFSIGILVDDAIVVVENIVRHWHMRGERSLTDTAIEAVAEVGNPTIVATLTIVVALLPMLFVSGLMGPYMSPIPANASLAMVFSFFVAMTITPWLLMKIARSRFEGADAHEGGEHDIGVMGRFYSGIATKLLTGRERSKRFLLYVGLATLASCMLFATKSVRVKLLPFDNKSEIAVVVDLPRGASLEETDRLLTAAAERLKDLPELTSIQSYTGTAAPFNFNGLVRHYYMREAPEMGDLSVNLLPKDERKRASHAIALDIRKRLETLAKPEHTAIKVVEVPPGPPVLATLLAEIYGPDANARRAIATKVRQAFSSVDFIVDTDDSFGVRSERLRYSIDQEALEYYGVEEKAVYDTIGALVGGVKIGFSQRGGGAKPIDITVALPRSAMSPVERILSTPLPAGGTARQGANVELGDVVKVTRELGSYPIFRHNSRFAEMVSARSRGPLRGADLWHVRGRGRHRRARLGQGRTADDQISRPAARQLQADAVVGWRMGSHLRHLPRHGRGLHGRLARDLPIGRRAVRLVQTAVGDPRARAFDAHRHHAWPSAIQRRLHRHLDDRLYRARRHCRSQFDPARRFHPASAREGIAAAGRFDRGGIGALQADFPHRRRGDDWRRLHPHRSDLSGTGDLTRVWPRLFHGADAACDSGDLCRASRRRGDA